MTVKSAEMLVICSMSINYRVISFSEIKVSKFDIAASKKKPIQGLILDVLYDTRLWNKVLVLFTSSVVMVVFIYSNLVLLTLVLL